MVEGDQNAFWSMPSHDPDYRFMVWDWEENTAAAFCITEAQADRIAMLLNKEPQTAMLKGMKMGENP